MGFHIQLLEDLRLIVTIAEGHVGQGDLQTHVEALNERARHLEGALELADCRSVQDVEGLTAIELRGAAGSEDAEGRSKGGKLAIVVASELIFGLGRIYGAISAQSREFFISYDLDEALEWLGVAEHKDRIVPLLPAGAGAPPTPT